MVGIREGGNQTGEKFAKNSDLLDLATESVIEMGVKSLYDL